MNAVITANVEYLPVEWNQVKNVMLARSKSCWYSTFSPNMGFKCVCVIFNIQINVDYFLKTNLTEWAHYFFTSFLHIFFIISEFQVCKLSFEELNLVIFTRRKFSSILALVINQNKFYGRSWIVRYLHFTCSCTCNFSRRLECEQISFDICSLHLINVC